MKLPAAIAACLLIAGTLGITTPPASTMAMAQASREAPVFATEGTTLEGTVMGDFVMVRSEMIIGTILWLDEPVTIEGNSDAERRTDRRDARNIDRILLEFADDAMVTDDLMGTRAVLTGTLHKEPNEYHHTDVVMLVTAIESVAE